MFSFSQDLLSLDSDSSFEAAFFQLRSSVRVLEQRLVEALKEAFALCPTLSAELKVLEMFPGVTKREAIQVRRKSVRSHDPTLKAIY